MNAMKNTAQHPYQSHKRTIKYIDHVMQKWLLVALVILEVIVLSLAGAYLYVRLNTIVDESLYRIHFAGQPSIFSILLSESLRIVGGMIAVNLVALLLADRIWCHYVNGVLYVLRSLFERARILDFQTDPDLPHRHKSIALALDWRRVERERHMALLQSLDFLDTLVASSEGEFRDGLLAFRAHLPDADL